MIDRRNFLKKTALVATGMVIGGSAKASASMGAFPAGIVYTREKPGKWAKKVGSHAPKVNVEGKNVTIHTMHPMSEIHYIVRHTLVSANGNVLGEKTFYPSDKEAISTYELPPDHKLKLYATSFCNLHDFWVTELNI